MSVVGLDEHLVAELARGVIPSEAVSSATGESDVQLDELADRFCRAAWSAIAEPGDSDAGFLVSGLGAVTALTCLVERRGAARTLAMVRERTDASAEGLEARLTKAFERWSPRLSSDTAVRSARTAAAVGATFLVPGDAAWPPGFGDLGASAPLGLWCRGDARRLEALGRSVALVGARAATGYGEHVTMEASAGLSDRGFAIVSGGAYGIDGTAHRAALASGQLTVAFLAGGVDRLYPSGHDALLKRIIENGVVAGELPCGVAPTRWRFLQRNRLIAAASQATVVLEAGRRSGSLNTAGHAAAIGRPLGAVPGPVTSPASQGCHRLIREYGAVCVTDAADMAELAGDSETSRDVGGSFARRDAAGTRVLDALSARGARTVDELATRTGMSVREVSSALGVLAIEGAARERDSGWIAARPSARG